MLLGCGSVSSWVRRLVACVGGCFGCSQPTPVIAVDEPSKGLRIQGQSVEKEERSMFDELWSSSPNEMENGTKQSQHSISSMSVAAQSTDQDTTGSSSNPNEFVNQGLLLWNQTRQQWVGNRTRKPVDEMYRLRKLCLDTSFEGLLGTTRPFEEPIPLRDMVDFLVHNWAKEGLYD